MTLSLRRPPQTTSWACTRPTEDSYSPECVERLSEKGKRVPRSWISEGAKRPNKAFSVRSWRLTVLASASLTDFQTVSEEEFCEVELPLYGVLGSSGMVLFSALSRRVGVG